MAEDEDGVGMKMKQLDLVRLQNRQEEVGERRDEAGVESMEEDGVEPLGEPAAGRPHLGGAVLVGVRRRQVAHLGYRRRGDAGRRHRRLEGSTARHRRRRAGRRAGLHRGLALRVGACFLGRHWSPEKEKMTLE